MGWPYEYVATLPLEVYFELVEMLAVVPAPDAPPGLD
jgi:hypothetical protein